MNSVLRLGLVAGQKEQRTYVPTSCLREAIFSLQFGLCTDVIL